MTAQDWAAYAKTGYAGKPFPGYVPKALVPAGRTDLPAGFVVGWRKLKTQPKLTPLSDEDALHELQELSEPEPGEALEIYHSKVESGILSLMIDAKQPLSRLEITRKLRSDYPVTEVARALDRLVRLGELSSYQQQTKLARQRFYRLPDFHA
jgi:hypothetical protein